MDFAGFKDVIYPLQEPCSWKAQAEHYGCFGLKSRIHPFQSSSRTEKQTSQGDGRCPRYLCYQQAWDGRAENWNRNLILAKLFYDSQNRQWSHSRQQTLSLNSPGQFAQTHGFLEDIGWASVAVTLKDWFLLWDNLCNIKWTVLMQLLPPLVHGALAELTLHTR